MDPTESFFTSLHDARIAPHAAGHLPAWLWSADGERILFANAAGAAIFGGDNVSAVLQKHFEASHPAATQIARLNSTLKHDGAPRLEKLRGFGAGFGRALLCLCSKISIGSQHGVLVVAAEPAGPGLTFKERVRRLIDGYENPLAAFSTDGTLIHANEQAAPLLADGLSLKELRNSGDAAIETIGEGSNAFVLARFVAAKQTPAPEPQALPEETADLAPIAQAMSQIEARLEEARAEAAAIEPATLEVAQEPSAPSVQPAQDETNEEKKEEAEEEKEPKPKTKRKKRKRTSGRNYKIPHRQRPSRSILNAGIRCVSSGKWMRRDASAWHPANSWM